MADIDSDDVATDDGAETGAAVCSHNGNSTNSNESTNNNSSTNANNVVNWGGSGALESIETR